MSPSLITALMATPIAFAAGNLYASNLTSLPGEPIANLATAAVTLPGFVAKGGGFTGEPAGICLGMSWLTLRESPGMLVPVAIIVALGYAGSFMGLFSGVRAVRELRHAGIVRS